MIKLSLKHLCFIITFCFLLLSCKGDKETSTIFISKIQNQGKKESVDSTLFTKMKVSSLPVGNEEVVKYFHEMNYNQRHGYLSENETQKVYDIEKNLDSYLNSSSIKIDIYKYPQKNNYDFGSRFRYELDSVSTDKGFYVFSNRLPDIGSNRIYLTHSLKNEQEEFKDFIINIDLVVFNQKNTIINSLNLNYFSSNSGIFSQGDIPVKHFYIDKDYIIHIKYFIYWGENSISTLAYVKYKIQEDGSIIRYFDQKGGAYKSYIEEGTIKNNTKEGKWKEYLGGHDNMYSILNYKNGIVDGKIEIFDANDIPDMADPEQRLFPRFRLELYGDKYIQVD